MTRFFVKTNFDDTLTTLKGVLEGKGYSCRLNAVGEVCISFEFVFKQDIYLVNYFTDNGHHRGQKEDAVDL
jgi:hypothetical protein